MIDETQNDRCTKCGEFITNATESQGLKSVVRIELFCKNEDLKEDQLAAFNMICHKIAGIINETPDYVDFWFEVENYSASVANQSKEKK